MLVDRSETGSCAQRLAGQGGFTVVEGLVAAIVLVVGLLATVTIFHGSRDQGATAERHQTAVGLASAELEQIRSLPYDQIALSTDPPASGEGSVVDRVQGAEFEIRGVDADGNGLELLVAPVNGFSGPVEAFTQGVDVGGEPMDIYRFVSWRDEECPLVPLEGSGVSDLFDFVHGPGGLDSLRGELATTIANVLAMGSLPIIGPIINGTLNTLINGVNGVNPRIMNVVNSDIDPALDSLESAVEDGVDLCDIDLAAIEQIASDVEALQTAIAALNGSLDALDAGLGSILSLNRNPLTILAQLQNLINGTINGLVNNAEDALDNGTAGTADDLLSAIEALRDTLVSLGTDTEQNTKRITVAILPRDRAGVGPFEPVWQSTVVTDPNEGIG